LSRAGIGHPVEVVLDRRKRTPAHVHAVLRRRGPGYQLEKVQLKVNPDIIEQWLRRDPEAAEALLKYMLAHEVGHLKQLLIDRRLCSTALAEHLSDVEAERLSGVSQLEAAVAARRLGYDILR